MDDNRQIPTGVPGFDRLLGGGLRHAGLHLIAGRSGTGKTILAHHVGSRNARAGETVLYLTALVESHRTLVAQAERFEFFDSAWLGRQFYYASLYPALTEGGVDGAGEEVGRLIREHRPELVVLDGLHVIKAAATNELEFIRFVNELQALSSIGGTTILAIINVEEERAGSVEFAVSDAIIRLGRERSGRRIIRTVEIDKLRGADPLTGSNVFTISDAGIRIFPRLEATIGELAEPTAPSPTRPLRLGIAGLDEMLSGGLPAPSATIVAGVPGAGKTLTGLSFVATGAAEDAPGLFVCFRETPDRLVAKAEHVGIPLRDAVETDMVRMVWKPSAEILSDEFAEEVFDLIDRHDIRRLVIDGLDDLGRMLVAEDRVTDFLTAFIDRLRMKGITTVLTQELRTIFGLEFRIPMEDFAASVDNILLLRYVELHARLHRLVSILKMRERAYDKRIREFEITERGIEVGETLDQAEGLLTGVGRLTEPKDGSE